MKDKIFLLNEEFATINDKEGLTYMEVLEKGLYALLHFNYMDTSPMQCQSVDGISPLLYHDRTLYYGFRSLCDRKEAHHKRFLFPPLKYSLNYDYELSWDGKKLQVIFHNDNSVVDYREWIAELNGICSPFVGIHAKAVLQ